MITGFCKRGAVSTVVGGQWGSEGKGAVAAWATARLVQFGRMFDIVSVNNGVQSGHTSIHNGKKRVLFHLPTSSLIAHDHGVKVLTHLNAGSVIDPVILEQELKDNPIPLDDFIIDPLAAVVTDECKEEEGAADSSTTKIASTRKGVGAALARKVMRKGMVAKDHPFLKQFVRRIDLNGMLMDRKSVLIEIPQGVSLSLSQSGFYPHTTSRDCTPTAAMADAGIHPSFFWESMVVLRTFPIRVGNIVEDGRTLGQSGGVYSDQEEVGWSDLGVEAEITTVTKRVRRVFTFSRKQIVDTFSICRPDMVVLTFVNYLESQHQLDGIVAMIFGVAKELMMVPPTLYFEWGPTTDQIGEQYDVKRVA